MQQQRNAAEDEHENAADQRHDRDAPEQQSSSRTSEIAIAPMNWRRVPTKMPNCALVRKNTTSGPTSRRHLDELGTELVPVGFASRVHWPCSGVSYDRAGEIACREWFEIVDAFADADEMDGQVELARRCATRMPPRAVPSSLVMTSPVTPGALAEDFDLVERVLAGGRVERQQERVGPLGRAFLMTRMIFSSSRHELRRGSAAGPRCR